jgi:hypothetical protein
MTSNTPAPLPSTPINVGLMTLPAGTVGLRLTDATQAFLNSVLASIPADKRGSARLVVDWKQVGGANVEAQIGAHIAGPVDVAAAAGWSQQQGAHAEALLRVEWD